MNAVNITMNKYIIRMNVTIITLNARRYNNAQRIGGGIDANQMEVGRINGRSRAGLQGVSGNDGFTSRYCQQTQKYAGHATSVRPWDFV
jgi:hypothetical protein